MNVSLYTDGGVIYRNPSIHGGMYAWVQILDDGKKFNEDAVFIHPERFDSRKVTNNNVELLAIIRGLRDAMLYGVHVTHIYSDSEISIGRLFYGYAWNDVPEWIVEERKQVTINGTKPIPLNGHPTKKQLNDGVGRTGRPVSKWNVYCDRLCRETGEAYMRKDFYV